MYKFLALLLLCTAPAWAATPTFEGFGTRSDDLDTPWTVTPALPTSWAADDIFIAGVLVGAGDGTISAPAGWTLLTSATGGTDAQIWWYWRRAVGGDGNPTFSLSAGGGGVMAAEIYGIRGCDTGTTPYEDATLLDSTSTADTTPDTSEITTTGTNRLAVAFFLIEDNAGWSTGPPPSGWTSERDQADSTGTDYRLTVLSKAEATATTVSAIAAGTLNTGERYASLTLAFCDSCGGAPAARRVFVVN